jgi:hypothetical protein
MTPRNENERRRVSAAMTGHSAAPFPTTRMFVLEDPSKFGEGMVVVEDGKPQRMMITKLVAGFAQLIWFADLPGSCAMPQYEIIHTSMLTLHEDQSWLR